MKDKYYVYLVSFGLHMYLGARIGLQVNYTRKIQHFAANLVPLLFSASQNCNCHGTLEVCKMNKLHVLVCDRLGGRWRGEDAKGNEFV